MRVIGRRYLRKKAPVLKRVIAKAVYWSLELGRWRLDRLARLPRPSL